MATAEYILPFPTRPVIITQGYDGPISHKRRGNLDYTHSLDFKLDTGTRILAAKGGVITLLWDRDSNFYTGLDPRQAFIGNFLEIRHEDGSFSHYQHLEKRSVQALGLQIGQQVEQGQPIGLTGLSGWIGPYPHLHFMVYRSRLEKLKGPSRHLETFPVSFQDYDGPLKHCELSTKFFNQR